MGRDVIDPFADLFSDDPMSRPLTYPGRLPQASGLLVGDRFVPLRSVAGEPAGHWLVEDDGHVVRLADHLRDLGAERLGARHRVIAVGSNAAPSQLRRKFAGQGAHPVIPLTMAEVHGIAPGVSAHISRNGYVPATPITAPGEITPLFVLWLDDRQLEILDVTEPNYDRCSLPESSFPVRLVSGVPLPACQVYRGKHGCLVDASGTPVRLEPQAALINRLLARSAALRGLCGASVEEFVARTKDAAVRESARAVFRSEGLAGTRDGDRAFRGTPVTERQERASSASGRRAVRP
jgi:hypothetical protein